MATITDNVPVIGASDSNGKDRLQDALISGNILFVSKSGLDTGLGNYGTPFLTIQKAIDTHGDPSDAADEKITKVIWIETGQYDEALTLRPAGSMLFVFNGPVVLGDGAGSANASSATARNITWAVDPAKKFIERPAVSFRSINSLFASTGDVAYATAFMISGNFVITDVASQAAQVYFEGVKLQGDVDLTGWTGDRLDFYVRDSFFSKTFGGASGADVHIVSAENTQFDELIHIHKYGRFIDCEVKGGMTLNSSNTSGGIDNGVPPPGFINTIMKGTFTGPSGSFLQMDSMSNRHFRDNSATLSTITKKLMDRGYVNEVLTVTISANAFTPDLFQAGIFLTLALAANVTINNPSNAKEGDTLEIWFLQDATGGRTYTFGAEFTEGTTVTVSDLATTASKVHKGLWERRGSKWELLAVSNDL